MQKLPAIKDCPTYYYLFCEEIRQFKLIGISPEMQDAVFAEENVVGYVSSNNDFDKIDDVWIATANQNAIFEKIEDAKLKLITQIKDKIVSLNDKLVNLN